MGIVLSAHSAFATDCASPADAVARAERAVLYADLAGGKAALAEAEAALGCSPPADPLLLGRMWLIEGGYYTDLGDRLSAGMAFAAARRVAPTLWLDALGPEKRKDYDAVAVPDPALHPGQVVIDFPAGGPATTWIDGSERKAPIQLMPGEWLVQAGSGDRVWFARIVLVSADQVLHVEVPAAPGVTPVAPSAAPGGTPVAPPVAPAAVVLPIAPPPGATSPPKPPVPPHTHLYPHLAVGVDLAFGGSLAEAVQLRETDPVTVITVPLELGGGVAGQLAWGRVVGSVAPVFRGRLRYVSADGSSERSAVAVGGHLAGGLSAGAFDFGLLGGYDWPGRAVGRGVIGLILPGAPLEVELRVGVDMLAGGTPKPAASLVLAFPGGRSPGGARD